MASIAMFNNQRVVPQKSYYNSVESLFHLVGLCMYIYIYKSVFMVNNVRLVCK